MSVQQNDTQVPANGSTLRAGMGQKIGRRWLVVIFLFALAYRGLCFYDTREHQLYCHPVVDAEYHHAWAERIMAGDWLGYGPDDVFKPPLYPYFLAGLYSVFGLHIAVVQWTQYVLGAFSCVLLALLAARLLGRATGRVAGLISAGYAPYVFFESQLLTPGVSIFLSLAALLVLIPPAGRPGYGRLAVAGLLFGLSAGFRPDVLLPALLVLGYLLFESRPMPLGRLATCVSCAALGVAVVVLPITVRNYRLTGQFIPISANAGINFYVGNASGADGVSAVSVGLRWERIVARVPQDVLEKPATSSRWWMRTALGEMAKTPVSAILRLGRKALAFFNRREFRNNICYHFMQRASWPLGRSPVQFAVVLPLAVCGLIAMFRSGDRRQRRAFSLCLWWTAGYFVVGVVFFVTARFRLPAVPLLILPAAWGLIQIGTVIRRRQWKMLLGYGAVVAGVGLLSWPMWFGRPEDGWVRDYVNLANSLRTSGDERGALEAYRKALTYRSDDPDAHYMVGRILLVRYPIVAAEHLEEARTVVPDSPDVLLALAQAQLAVGKVDPARQNLEELLRVASTSNLMPRRSAWATAHIILADLDLSAARKHWEKAWSIDRRTTAEASFIRRREYGRVLETFRAVAREDFWNWYAHANYGMILLATDQPEKAVVAFGRAVKLAPQREPLRFHLARALLRAGRKEKALRLLDQLLDELSPCAFRDQVETMRAGISTAKRKDL